MSVSPLSLILYCGFLINGLHATPVVTNPQVGEYTVTAMSPWSVFVSWKQPEGKSADEISEYKLTGGITQTRQPGDTYVFCFVDSGIMPGSSLTVAITVVYVNGGQSDPLEKTIDIPSARK